MSKNQLKSHCFLLRIFFRVQSPQAKHEPNTSFYTIRLIFSLPISGALPAQRVHPGKLRPP